MPLLLIVGAADTGRAPIAAALLRRMLEQRGAAHTVESAGVLGHDGDGATSDALATADQLNLDISEHIARSLTDELAGQAALLIAIDSGTARVARARFPAAATRTRTLGDLAGRARDIPDPFKMQIGAWLTYAIELEAMLRAALPRIQAALAGEEPPAEPARLPDQPASAPPEPAPAEPAPTTLAPERVAAVARIQRLLDVLAQMPGVVDWAAARIQIEAELASCEAPAGPGDAAPGMAGLVRAALALTPERPSAPQIAALRQAAGTLAARVPQAALTAFSAQLATWSALQ